MTFIISGTSGATFPDSTTQSTAAVSGANSQIFTSNGTFTIPTGVSAIKVTVVGAGGGSAGVSAPPVCGAYRGGGGGGGAMGIQFFTGLTSGNTLTVTVGTGGTAGASGGGAGGTGGTSSVASGTQTITTVSAPGGSGGTFLTTLDATAPGAGGAAPTGAAIAIPGVPRKTVIGSTTYLTGLKFNQATQSLVIGASSPLGGPELLTATATNPTSGNPGVIYGAGASGAYSANPSGAIAGSAGAGGVVIIEW